MSLKKLGLAAILSLAALPALAQQTQTVRIGATPGPHAQILEAVKPIAARKGLDIQLIRANTVKRRYYASQNMISTTELLRTFDCNNISYIFDHTNSILLAH